MLHETYSGFRPLGPERTQEGNTDLAERARLLRFIPE